MTPYLTPRIPHTKVAEAHVNAAKMTKEAQEKAAASAAALQASAAAGAASVQAAAAAAQAAALARFPVPIPGAATPLTTPQLERTQKGVGAPPAASLERLRRRRAEADDVDSANRHSAGRRPTHDDDHVSEEEGRLIDSALALLQV